jgi:hypothetical protein
MNNVIESQAVQTNAAGTPENPTVTFNNKVYLLAALDTQMQDMIKIHQLWQQEHETARREVFKLEAALKGLMSELELRFKAVDSAAAAVQPQE